MSCCFWVQRQFHLLCLTAKRTCQTVPTTMFCLPLTFALMPEWHRGDLDLTRIVFSKDHLCMGNRLPQCSLLRQLACEWDLWFFSLKLQLVLRLWLPPHLCRVCFCTCLCVWAGAFAVLFLSHRLWFACFPSYYLMAGFLSPSQEQIEFSDRRLFALSLKPCNLSWSWIRNEQLLQSERLGKSCPATSESSTLCFLTAMLQ